MGVSAQWLASLFPNDAELTVQRAAENMAYMAQPYATLAEKLAAGAKSKALVSPTADAYVIHAWDMKWSALAAALVDDALDRKRFVWLSLSSGTPLHPAHAASVAAAASVPAPAPAPAPLTPPSTTTDTTPLPRSYYLACQDVLRTCKCVELVLGPRCAPCPAPFRRAWCAWEMHGAAVLELDVRVVVAPPELRALTRRMAAGNADVDYFQPLSDAMRPQCVEEARSSNPRDQERLRIEIRNATGEAVRESLLRFARRFMDDAEHAALYDRANSSPDAVANIIESRGMFLSAVGDFAEARRAFQESYDYRLQHAPGSAFVGAAAHNLAYACKCAGDVESTRAFYEDALARLRVTLDPAHPAIGDTLVNLGIVTRQHTRDFTGAKRMLEEALAVRRRAVRACPPTISATAKASAVADVAASLSHVAEMLRVQGDYFAAADRYREALKLKIEALGGDHYEVGVAYNNLGVVLVDQGDYEGAELVFNEACEVLSDALGDLHSYVVETLVNLIDMHRVMGRLVSAHEEAAAAEQLVREVHGGGARDSTDVALVLNELGLVLLDAYEAGVALPDLGDARNAVEVLQDAYRMRVRLYGKAHQSVATSLFNLAAAHRAYGQVEAARRCGEEALRIREAVLGAQHSQTILARREWGASLALARAQAAADGDDVPGANGEAPPARAEARRGAGGEPPVAAPEAARADEAT